MSLPFWFCSMHVRWRCWTRICCWRQSFNVLNIASEHVSPHFCSTLNESGWIMTILTNHVPLPVCVYVCVSFRLSAAHAPSSVVAVCSVHSAFCHPYAGLPVLLLCVLAAVHPNMALLPTGITTVRSASMRSRATVWPWEMTRHSHRRKFLGPRMSEYHPVIIVEPFAFWLLFSGRE